VIFGDILLGKKECHEAGNMEFSERYVYVVNNMSKGIEFAN
jgi:hypothetical protein